MPSLAEIQPGLWRWTAPHPEWRAGAPPESVADWPREVGSVLYEADEAAVLIDPLVPGCGGAALQRELDRRIQERGARVVILTTIRFHRRSGPRLAERYGASTSRARRTLPTGIEPLPIRNAGETMFWLPEHRALVPGDRLLGTPDGGLRMCPESWLGYLRSGLRLDGLRELLRPLLALPIERVLTPHGGPVSSDGHAALAEALRG